MSGDLKSIFIYLIKDPMHRRKKYADKLFIYIFKMILKLMDILEL